MVDEPQRQGQMGKTRRFEARHNPQVLGKLLYGTYCNLVRLISTAPGLHRSGKIATPANKTSPKVQFSLPITRAKRTVYTEE